MHTNRILFLAAIAVSFVCGAGFVFFMNDHDDEDPVAEARTFILEHAISEHLSVDRLDKGATDGAILGMVQSLEDEHSSYSPVIEGDDGDVGVGGHSFVGVGLLLREKDGRVTVQKIIPDSPASGSPIERHDVIVAINGESLRGASVEKAVGLLRGAAGTEVTVTFEDADGDPFEVTLVRSEIRMPIVTAEVLERSEARIAYLSVATFDERTNDEFLLAVTTAVLTGPTAGIVLDLRGNTGGQVAVAESLACQWIPDGEIVLHTIGRDEESTGTIRCNGIAPLDGIPTIVLVDGLTASASEIVAGALQDHGKALIMGTKTFGKGVGQRPHVLKNGAELRIVTFRWFTPNGTSVTGTGIIPDEELPERTPSQILGDEPDSQLEHALLHLAEAP